VSLVNDPFAPLAFARGAGMKNRFMLAPLTNCQSHDDGCLSDDEFRWLMLRAEGGFGLTMTCASHVQARGQGFPGQLGVYSERHVEGLTRLAAAIKARDSVAMMQLHHAGMRAPAGLIGETPVCPSDDAETGARALALDEVKELVDDFVTAAVRAERAGFDGVEIHGAHGYVISQFLSPDINQRADQYGGSPENRARLLSEIVSGVRASCRAGFLLGVRLSPERFGLRLGEIRTVAQQLLAGGAIDLLDLSLWDVFKEPEEAEFKGRSLMSYFTELDRGATCIGVAGKITGGEAARSCLEAGADIAIIGRGAILHHDFPERVRADPGFRARALPVTVEHLRAEGLGPAFIRYMQGWKGFVADAAT
jgi:2,4-dienoyl-CoA reductase-like NADH-dependent reductase (Old Yellow Enzyme family)